MASKMSSMDRMPMGALSLLGAVFMKRCFCSSSGRSETNAMCECPFWNMLSTSSRDSFILEEEERG
jgi:hypothetical protein